MRATFFLVLLALLTGCGSRPETPAPPPETYAVRGLVRHLPEPGGPVREILLHHEAIPEFRDDRGEVVGMDAMSMSFPVTEAALFEGLAVGDKVRFEFEVAWSGSTPLRVTRIEKLPPETELDFAAKAGDGN